MTLTKLTKLAHVNAPSAPSQWIVFKKAVALRMPHSSRKVCQEPSPKVYLKDVLLLLVTFKSSLVFFLGNRRVKQLQFIVLPEGNACKTHLGTPLQVSSFFARSKACSLDHRQTWSWGLSTEHSLQPSRPANLSCPDREVIAREWPTPKSVVTNSVEFRVVNAGGLLLAWLGADGLARAVRCVTNV